MGMDLSARLPSWGYLLRRGASEHASCGGYIARALQRGKQRRRRPWQKGRHGPSMLHLANTDGCQGLVSQACPLQVAPRPSEPTLKGPSHCLRGLSCNDMPHSPPKLHRRAPPPRQWEERCLSLGYCCRRIMAKGKMFRMIVSLLGLWVGDLLSESHHNKETKSSTLKKTNQNKKYLLCLVCWSNMLPLFWLEFRWLYCCGSYKVNSICFNYCATVCCMYLCVHPDSQLLLGLAWIQIPLLRASENEAFFTLLTGNLVVSSL